MSSAPAWADLRVDAERLWRSLMEMAEIGATPEGGCRRLALTDEDRAALDLLAEWVRGAGYRTTQDRVGNFFAERPGADPERPAVLVGSHLDTQPSGGRFDGAYGTLAALEVLRTLDDHGIETLAPVVAVSWTHEEGARFPLPCTGSAVFAGALSLADALAQRATDGPSFGEELERVGMVGPERPGSRRFACFLELHIEQGVVLERAGATVGIVSRGQGVRGIELRLAGAESHSGTTPMDARRDALVGAARIVTAVRELPDAHAGALATVGALAVGPGSRTVVPGSAELIVDLRHPELEALERMEAEVRRRAGEVAEAEGLGLAIDTFLRIDPVVFDEACVEAIRAAAELVAEPALELVSGAGHDAFWVGRTTPAAMVFIPCRDGISHSPAEHVEPEHARAGCDVLLHAVLARAGVAGGSP